MATQRLAVFQGADSTSGPVVLNNIPIFNGDKILSVMTLAPALDANDWASAFSATGFNAVAVQAAGHNFAGRTFIALVQNG